MANVLTNPEYKPFAERPKLSHGALAHLINPNSPQDFIQTLAFLMKQKDNDNKIVLEHYIAHALNEVFNDNKKQSQIFDEMFFILMNSQSLDEFKHYKETLLRELFAEFKHIPNQTSLIDNLIIALGNYTQLLTTNLVTINQQFNREAAHIVGIGASSIVAPIAGVVSPVAQTGVAAAVKLRHVYKAGVKVTKGDEKISFVDRVAANFKSGWEWITDQASKAKDYAKQNPIKAFFGGLVALAIAPLAIVFSPIILPSIGAVVGVGQLGKKAYESHTQTMAGMSRVDRFSELMHALRGDAYHHIHTSSLAIAESLDLNLKLSALRDANPLVENNHQANEVIHVPHAQPVTSKVDEKKIPPKPGHS